MKLLNLIISLFVITNLNSQIIEEGKGFNTIYLGLKSLEIIEKLGEEYTSKKDELGFSINYKNEDIELFFDKDSILFSIVFPPTINLVTSKGLMIKEGLTVDDVTKTYGYRDWTLSETEVLGYDIGIIFYYEGKMVTQIEIDEQDEDYIDVTIQEYLDEVYIPKDLEESIEQINTLLNQETINEIRLLSEDEFLTKSHFGLGKNLRNYWGLWAGSRFAVYFNNLGISHPDDMSGIILTSYHRVLNNQEINLNQQIIKIQKYWEGVEITQLPDESEYPEPNLEFRNIKSYGHYTTNKKWAEVYIQTNSISNEHWIYDYYYGWKKIDTKTKENLWEAPIDKTEEMMDKIFKN
ncbi:MAG: DUF6794 domain-containing protein [Flavobacteriaceae bacterium]